MTLLAGWCAPLGKDKNSDGCFPVLARDFDFQACFLHVVANVFLRFNHESLSGGGTIGW
jgi:hypothetical protein